jgi:SNF2 family DNA or RNA helicase
MIPCTSWNCQVTAQIFRDNGWEIPKDLVLAYKNCLITEKDKMNGVIGDVCVDHVADQVLSNWDRYQEYGSKWLLSRRRCVLADEQGMGKTITALGAFSEHYNDPSKSNQRLLVITTAIGLLNWRDECGKWIEEIPVRVLNVNKKNTGVPLEEAGVLIINYDSVDKYMSDIDLFSPTHIVIDEAHHVKNPDSARAKNVKKVIDNRESPYVWAADGTPLLRSNRDFYGLMKTINPNLIKSLGGDRYFLKTYCGAHYQVIGYLKKKNGEFILNDGKKILNKQIMFDNDIGNSEELSNRIRYLGAILHRKHATHNPGKYTYEVKTHYIEKEELTTLEQYELAEDDFDAWKASNNDFVPDDKDHPEDAMLQKNVLERLTGQGKVAAGIARCFDILKTESKLVVFAHNVDVQNAYIAAFPECMRLQSGMSPQEKHKSIESFQKDPEVHMMVASIGVAQEVINLSASKYAFMAQYISSPKLMEQVYRRLARRGQTEHVIVEHLHAKNTRDDEVREMVEQRRVQIDQIMNHESELEIMKNYSEQASHTPT